MPPTTKGKHGAPAEKDKIPIATLHELLDELRAFKAALAIQETEHTWEALDRAVKRFTAVTRGGGYRFEHEFVAGLKDRDLAKALNGCLATERTQLSASTLLFFSAATRLGASFGPLLFLYLPGIIRLLSRTNKLYVSRATACLIAIVRNTRLAGVIPYLREGMTEKAPTHRKGCIQTLLCVLGGPDSLATLATARFEGLTVDKDIVQRKYLNDIETCMRIGARDRDIEVRKFAKKCWEIYRSEFSERVAGFAAPLTPIARKYLELPAAGLPVPSYGNTLSQSQTSTSLNQYDRPAVLERPPKPAANPVSRPMPPPPRAPSPIKQSVVRHRVEQPPSVRPPAQQVEFQRPEPSSQAISRERQLQDVRQDSGKQAYAPPPFLHRQTAPLTIHAARRVLSASIPPQEREIPQRPPVLSRSATVATSTYPVPVVESRPLLSQSVSAAMLPPSLIQQTAVSSNDATQAARAFHQHDTAAVSLSSMWAPVASAKLPAERPTSACSVASTSSLASSTRSQREPFKPSPTKPTVTATHSVVSEPAPVQLPPIIPPEIVRPTIPHHRRAVPLQTTRAPMRTARRASRVLPPSLELETQLAARIPLPQDEPMQSEAVVLPLKRPASAMSQVGTSSEPAEGVHWHASMHDDTRQRPSPPPAAPATATGHAQEMPEESQDAQQSPSQIDIPAPFAQHTVRTETPASAAPFLPPANIDLKEDDTEENHTIKLSQVAQAIDHPSEPAHDQNESAVSDETDNVQQVERTEDKREALPAPLSAKPDNNVTGNAHASETIPSASEPSEPATLATAAVSGTTMPSQAPTPKRTMPEIVSTATGTASFDFAAFAAQIALPPASSDAAQRPMFANNRKKTAFRPQKHHRPAPSAAVTATEPLKPTETQQLFAPEATVPQAPKAPEVTSLFTLPEARAVPSSTLFHLPAQLGVDGNAVPAQRSVSASMATYFSRTAPIPEASQAAEPDRAAPSLKMSAGPSTRPQLTRKPEVPSRGPPPAKKQALSRSAGPSTATTSVAATRKPVVKQAPATSSRFGVAPVPKVPVQMVTAPKQGSIFDRLSAPTAASTARAKARIPLASKEPSKRTAPAAPLAKKASQTELRDETRLLNKPSSSALSRSAPPTRPEQAAPPNRTENFPVSAPASSGAAPTSRLEHGSHYHASHVIYSQSSQPASTATSEFRIEELEEAGANVNRQESLEEVQQPRLAALELPTQQPTDIESRPESAVKRPARPHDPIDEIHKVFSVPDTPVLGIVESPAPQSHMAYSDAEAAIPEAVIWPIPSYLGLPQDLASQGGDNGSSTSPSSRLEATDIVANEECLPRVQEMSETPEYATEAAEEINEPGPALCEVAITKAVPQVDHGTLFDLEQDALLLPIKEMEIALPKSLSIEAKADITPEIGLQGASADIPELSNDHIQLHDGKGASLDAEESVTPRVDTPVKFTQIGLEAEHEGERMPAVLASASASKTATASDDALSPIALAEQENTTPMLAPEGIKHILAELNNQPKDSEAPVAPSSPASTIARAQSISPALITTSAERTHSYPSQSFAASIPLPDTSASICVSPTQSMRALLASSIRANAREESALLSQEEYMSDKTDDYGYDETFVDLYAAAAPDGLRSRGRDSALQHSAPFVSQTSSMILQHDNILGELAGSLEPNQAVPGSPSSPEEPRPMAQLQDAAQSETTEPPNASPINTTDEEDEDDVALLISRELSDDSLEDLASRWEESRIVLGGLDADEDNTEHHLQQQQQGASSFRYNSSESLTGDMQRPTSIFAGLSAEMRNNEGANDDEIENTPMRPRLLTRLSNSSNYSDSEDEDQKRDEALTMHGFKGKTPSRNMLSGGSTGLDKDKSEAQLGAAEYSSILSQSMLHPQLSKIGTRESRVIEEDTPRVLRSARRD